MRHARIIGLAALAGGTLLLTGCAQQPLPKITVHHGTSSTSITPSRYCSDAKHCRSSKSIDLPTIVAKPGSRVLVDVPREVVGHGWAVQALSLSGAALLGSSGPIRDKDSYRVASNVGGGAPFIVAVSQLRDGRADGSRWSFLVREPKTKGR